MFAKIGYINKFYFGYTGLSCMPNNGNIVLKIPTNTTIPVCNMLNEYGCTPYYEISGKIYKDSLNNCNVDSGDQLVQNIKVQLWKNNILELESFTNLHGLYTFTAAPGIYKITIDTVNSPFEFTCPSTGILYDTVTGQGPSHNNLNIGLRCRNEFDLVAKSISATGIFRPANYNAFSIHAGDLSNFYNTYCAYGISGQVKVIIDGPATFISPANGAIAPTINGDTLEWDVADFGAINGNTAFNFVLQTDTFAQSGATICLKLIVTPFSDNDSTNNTFLHCFAVVNSYDPNDKQVYPIGKIDTTQEWLIYKIRFQNTGTAEAQHIYITDTLHSNTDATSFQLLDYSHQPDIKIKGQAIRFNFPYINLPDSNINEPASHGYIQFKVKLKSGLQPGAHINNKAFIYFDFNEPVITNTANNYICTMQYASIQRAICRGETYNFYGASLTEAGSFQHVTSSLVDCDSTITISLSLNEVNTSVEQNNYTLNANETNATYQWFNCSTTQGIADSTANSFTAFVDGEYAVVITKDGCVDTSNCHYVNVCEQQQATSISHSICGGDVYDFFGTPLSGEGIYLHTLQAGDGCDSVISLTLSVNDINLQVSQAAQTLTANAINASYQWIDCNTQQPIDNANAQNYTTTTSGSYAVMLSANNCTDTSACYTVIVSGIAITDKDAFDFQLIPNPTKDIVNVYIGSKGEHTIRFYNTQGALINETTSTTQTNTMQLIDMASGVYYIEVQSGNNIARKRIIKL